MANVFKSGSFVIPAGVEDVNVTGISLAFNPSQVIVNVRQPQTDAPIIQAVVFGTPTSSGFTVHLTAPAFTTGYLLDWTAFGDGSGPTPSAGDSMAASYTLLRDEVARFLGYNPASLTTDQANVVDSYVQSGVQQFYYPPAMNGVDVNAEWNFLRMSGEVMLSQGVSEYYLPSGFGRISGQLTFKNGECRKTVPVVPYGDVKRMLESNGSQGVPEYVAVNSTFAFEDGSQRKKLYVYPTPDSGYTLCFEGDSDHGKISATTNPYPLGGAMYRELIIESCLAIAEQRANDEIGLHTQRFNELLVSSIQRDRKEAAHNFGKIGDPKHRCFW